MNSILQLVSKDPVDILLLVVFLYPILKGFLFKFSSKNLKNDIEDANSYIAFIIGSILGVYVSKSVFINHESGIYKSIYYSIPESLIELLENRPIFIYIAAMPIIIFIIYKIIELFISLLNRITIYPILDGVEELLTSKSSITKRILGSLFQLPKAICYTLLIAFAVNLLVMAGISDDFNKKLEKSRIYAFLSEEFINPITKSNLAKELPDIISNSFKIEIKNGTDDIGNITDKTIVYYNGTTLEEAVKSNEEIDNFARKLTKNEHTTKDKAKKIYDWIGQNIEYDYDKAKKILNNDFSIKSGAINTYNTRKGICFDYSSLYYAMAKANGMKVRIITGEGFNGVSWISHAWNQVYLEEENRWINVDTTFYKGGDYFDSPLFNLDHREAQIAQ